VKSRLPNMRRRRRPAAAVLALLAFTSVACVKQKPPGVAIKNLKADIVFGLNPPTAGPPAFSPPIDIFDLGPTPILNQKLPFFPPPLPGLPCRVAQITDAPERAVSTDIHGQPEAGHYRWKLGGTLRYGNVDVPISPGVFFDREVVDVSTVEETTVPAGGDPATAPINTRTFSYTLRSQLGVAGQSAIGTQEVRFQVRDNPVVASVNNTVLGGGVGKSVVVGDPERGITLKSLVEKDANGKVTRAFNPSPGLLLLPLRVNPGERYQSVGVDPATGTVAIHDGFVDKRDFVDACGDLIQGWRVNSRQTFINGSAATGDATQSAVVAQYDYMFAPQYGGMLIYEKISPPDVNSTPIPTPPVIPGSPTPNIPSPPTTLPPLPVALPGIGVTYEYTLGQLHPTKVP
jgi:hypothetical protein